MSSDGGSSFPFPVFVEPPPARGPQPIFERFDDAAHGTGPATGREESPPDEPLPPGVRQRIEMLGKEAYEKAFALGEKAGRDLGEAAVHSMVEKLAKITEEISQLRSLVLRESRRELVDLSLQIARAVVGAEVSVRPEIVLESAGRAIQRIGTEGRITLRVHPSDAENIWKRREALFPYLSGKGDLSVEPDESVERGGCLAVTDFSEADATIAGQFEVVREHLRKVLEEAD